MRTEAEPTGAEDLVTDRELADGRANGFDLSSKFGAEDPPLRPAEAKDQAAHKGEGEAATSVGFTCRAVQPIDRRGVDLDQDLSLFGYRPLDVFEPQNVRRPVPVEDDGSHFIPRGGFPRRWCAPPSAREP